MCDRVLCGNGWLPTILVALAASWAGAQELGGSGPPDSEAVGSGQAEADRASILIHTLRRMDIDEDGLLEPSEISDQTRPYVQRVAKLAALDGSAPLSMDALETAVRRHYGNERPRPPYGPRRIVRRLPEMGDSVNGFGQVEGLEPIPGFGADSEFFAAVEKVDLDRAAERLRQYDKNQDGYLDSRELRDGRWYDDPYQYDKNQDGRLSLQELALRYAQRRTREAQQQERSSSRPESDGQRRNNGEDQQRRREAERGRQDYYANREVWRLAETLVGRYDANRNGVIDGSELENAGIPAAADADGRGRVDRRELALWLAERSAKMSRQLPAGLPDWFARRDANGDGQVVMAEFAEEWTEDKATEFAKYDLDEDGILMPDECVRATTVPIGKYTNHQFQIIPAHGLVYSDVEIRDAVEIADLDVQLSITHTMDGALDVFLIGPQEDRIELFTGVGGSDDHFQNTILDDESQTPIVKARPPFAGRFQPEAVLKRQPSLKTFYGSSATGTWTLMIRAQRSDRPGVLHGWSLIVTPAEVPEEMDELEIPGDAL
ncbi:MAG: proprotein convertase P-domain-containing protein [Pirellulales bacterium]|nr:proprotein convertase P-domain-containing protein [Pirellulales bacterium]